MGLNRERAETQLRLVAEAALRRGAAHPQAAAAAALHGLPERQREAIALQYYARLPELEIARTTGLSIGTVRALAARAKSELRAALAVDTSRVASVAEVLTTVHALDREAADRILADFAQAAGCRRAGRRGPDPDLVLLSPGVHVPLAMLVSPRSAAADAARSAGPGTASWHVVPVGQLIPVRGHGRGITGERQEVTGQMYVLSYVRTAAAAWLTVAVRTRGEFVPPGFEPSYQYWPSASFPVDRFTATDDRGTRYELGLRGRGEPRFGQLTGQLTLRPDPPPDIRWLDLVTGPGQPAVRIGLNRPPDGTGPTASPGPGPGEHLLHTIAMRLLLLALEFPEEIRLHPAVPLPEPFSCIADGLGDTVTALQACGALSPLSPVPGQLAALCADLNVTGHGLTARPARELPEPWLSMLSHYRRRRPRIAGDGCAALAATLPDLDGIRLALLGLHNSGPRTVLFAQAAGMPDGRLGADVDFPLRLWVRDSGGRWHATRASGWTGAGDGEVTMRLRVLPPVGRDAAWIDVVTAGSSAQARVTLPLRWC